MGQYTQYIQEHIINFNGQHLIHWNTQGYRNRLEIVCSRYREIHGTNDLAESINRLDDSIGREDVRNLFVEEKFYDGFVATMLWGGINLSRNNDIRETNGYKALIIKKDDIEEKLKQVSKLLSENKLKDAFVSFLSNEENHFDGVGLSYFTKLLFFIPNNISPKPLIYDKWGIRIHAALIKDENGKYDNTLNINDPQPNVKGGNNKEVLFRSYQDYCSRINNLYGSLNIESSKDIEAFLFGMPLKGTVGKDPERNPRKMLVDYLNLDNCNKQASPKKENVENKPKRKGRSTESTLMTIPDEFINNIRNQFHSINIEQHKWMPGGLKTALSAEISGGWTLAVGSKEFYFCGIYKKGRTDNPYPEIFDESRTYGYYKRFNAAQEALNQFKDILQKENHQDD